MKRCDHVAVWLLLIVVVFGLLTGCGGKEPTVQQEGPVADSQMPSAPETQTPAAEYEDRELARAVELGIGDCREREETVTYGDFLKMLDRVVELSCGAVPAEWAELFPQARRSDREMTRPGI